MHRKTMFKIKIDFDRSHDSYLYDKNRQKYFLDFFGLYATLPLGYNHPIFKTSEFIEEYTRIAGVKVPNGEMISDEADEFDEEFSGHPSMKPFEYFHFNCTGALAIESAIKVAIDHKGISKPVVISLKESFHGINSYGGFVTDRFVPVKARLDGFPEMGWPKIHNPKIVYSETGDIDQSKTQEGLDIFKKEFDGYINQHGVENVVALLVEPIQSTSGDNYFPMEFFKLIRGLCDQHNICLIFDEIQTGFGGTGKMWYFEHTPIIPDIVVFGKKTQSSGIMVAKKFDKLFKTPIRLEVTWDGNLQDMVRCKYILRAYEQYKIFDNIRERNKQLVAGLKEIDVLKNVRATGLLVAFDFDSPKVRGDIFDKIFEKRMLCNKTKDKSIRLRPNLNVSEEEVREALNIIKEVCE